MNKLGPLMIATGIGHALVGIVVFNDAFMAIFREGFINTVQPPGYDGPPAFDRIAVFWFLFLSPVLSMLGQIVSRAITSGAVDVLRVIGWNLIVMGTIGAVVFPISGNWILIALGALTLGAASRVEARSLPA